MFNATDYPGHCFLRCPAVVMGYMLLLLLCDRLLEHSKNFYSETGPIMKTMIPELFVPSAPVHPRFPDFTPEHFSLEELIAYFFESNSFSCFYSNAY